MPFGRQLATLESDANGRPVMRSALQKDLFCNGKNDWKVERSLRNNEKLEHLIEIVETDWKVEH